MRKFCLHKNLQKAIAALLALSLVLAGGLNVFAASYKDVPASYWAFAAIADVSGRGVMVGDASGNFNPNGLIDKFDTAKIFARAAGYDPTTTSAADLAYYDQAYNQNKNLLAQFAKAFTKWNGTADREIAFLLEKEILTADDLNQFVIKDTNGSEQLRALSKQEACVFLVRVMDRKTEALTNTVANPFADDSSIAITDRPYVYYLRTLGVIAGDGSNLFGPNTALTRAGLASMLDKGLSVMDVAQAAVPAADQSTSNPPAAAPAPTTSVGVSKVETVTGTIDKFYTDLNAIQVITDGKKNIYALSPQMTVYVDSFLKTLADLKEGMTITAVVNNGAMVSIQAQSITSAAAAADAAAPAQFSTLAGTVISAGTDATGRTIGIEVRMLSPTNAILTDTRSYILTSDCAITRNGAAADFASITPGEMVTAQISGASCYSLALQSKDREITGATLTAKNLVNGAPTLTVSEQDGTSEDLRVVDASHIYRKNTQHVTWNDLRVGDTLDAYLSYNDIDELYAVGSQSTVEGTLDELRVTTADQTLVLRDAANQLTTYIVEPNVTDIFSLRVGMRVRLGLDSREVASVTVLQDAQNTYLSGYIQTLGANGFTYRDASDSSVLKQLVFDQNSIITDAATGSRLTAANLQNGMRVYVVLAVTGGNVVRSLTVLQS